MSVSNKMEFPWSDDLIKEESRSHTPKASSKHLPSGTSPSSTQSPKGTLEPVTVSADWDEQSDDSDTDDDVFDYPSTPVKNRGAHDSLEPTTPLTPPTTPPDTSSPCSARQTEDHAILKAVAAANTEVKTDTNGSIKEQGDSSAANGGIARLQPTKLFRNLTDPIPLKASVCPNYHISDIRTSADLLGS